MPSITWTIVCRTICPNSAAAGWQLSANPQSYNRYSYVGNRVLNATDPTGHRDLAIDEGSGAGLDIRLPILSHAEAEKALKSIGQTATTAVSVVPGLGDVIDVYDLVTSLVNGDYAETGIILGMAVLPGAGRLLRSGGEEIVEFTARNLDEVAEGVNGTRILSARNWRNAEDVLGDCLGLPKNTERYFVEGMSTYRIPDFIGDDFIADSKFYGASALNVSPQLEDFVTLAKDQEVPLYIFVREGTHVSGNALKMIQTTGGDIIRVFEGP